MELWRKFTHWVGEVVEGLVLPLEQGKETKMSDKVVIDVLVKAAKHAQKVSIKRKFGPSQRVGEFVTTLRRELGYADLRNAVDNGLAKKESWRDILQPTLGIRNNRVYFLAQDAREKAGWDKVESGSIHETEEGVMHQKYDEPEEETAEMQTQSTGELVVSRKAWKFGNYSTTVHYAHDGRKKTLCDMPLNSSDVPIQLVKNESVAQCSCPRCNTALEVAERSGKRVTIARVKKKTVKGKDHASDIIASRKKGAVPKGCVRYICKDCSQTITVMKKNRPDKCFQCKSTNVVEDGEITITARSTDYVRYTCKDCSQTMTVMNRPDKCCKCESTNVVEDTITEGYPRKNTNATVKKWVCMKCKREHFVSDKPKICWGNGCNETNFYLRLPDASYTPVSRPKIGDSLRSPGDEGKTWADHVEGLP